MAEAQLYGKVPQKKKRNLSLQIKNTNKKKHHILEAQTQGSILTMNYTEAPLSATYWRTFHLGGKKYVVFNGEAGQL